MNDDLQDVLSAAVESNRVPTIDTSARRATQLHAVKTGHPGATPMNPISRPLPAAPAIQVEDEGDQLGRRGLRLGFWLCGFHSALVERQERGETLTEREASLLELSRKDFADMRPLVITMAIKRLHAVVTSPTLHTDEASVSAVEVFALETICNLSARASHLLHDQGPDVAMSMFGSTGDITEPLAIFQAVFATALGVVEAFERIAPHGAKFLPQLVAALDSELERV